MSKKFADAIEPDAQLGLLQIPALFPLHIASYDGGLGRRSLDTPVVVYIKTPSNAYPGQLLELFANDPLLPVAHTFVSEGDSRRDHVPLILPAASIKPDWIDPLVARINLTGQSTLPLRVRVDLNGPGDSHGLRVQLPADVLVDGVSEARARENIQVILWPYPYMAANDHIQLYWGDQRVQRWLDAKDVGKPVTLLVLRRGIMEARDYESLRVAVLVRGHTGNYAEPSVRWAMAGPVNVHVHNDPLDAPVINGQDPQTGVIDIEQLNGLPATAYVYASRTYFEVGETLHFFWQTIDAQARRQTFSQSREVLRLGQTYSFELAHESIRDLAQGHLTAYYVLEKRTGPLHSSATFATVHGPIDQWPAPHVGAAGEDGRLPAETPGFTVNLAYAHAWKPSTLVTLVWLLPDPKGAVQYRYSRSAGERPANGHLEWWVPEVEVGRFLGRHSQLYYEADEAGTSLGESLRLPLKVGKLWTPLRAPVVTGAAGHLLDPDRVSDGADVMLPNVPAYQRVRLHWHGPGGSIIIALRPQASGDIWVTVPASLVKDNLNHTVKVYWTLHESGQVERYSDVLTLQIVRQGLPPTR